MPFGLTAPFRVAVVALIALAAPVVAAGAVAAQGPVVNVASKPFVVLGNFWLPILERVREVEFDHASPWSEAKSRLVHHGATPAEVAEILARALAPVSR